MSCLIETKTFTRWKKLTTWWSDCSHYISSHNSENWPQRNGSKLALGLKMNCTENNQNGTGQITDDQFHHDCWAYCAVCMPPLPPPIEALAHCLSAGGGRSWPLDRCPPIPWLPTFENKQTFLSTSLASLLAFELWSPGPTFNNRFWRQHEAAFLAVSRSGGFPKWSHRHDDTWEAREKPIAPGFLAAGVDLRAIPSSCQSFVSGFLPVSPLLSPGGQGSLSSVEWKDASGWADSTSTSVHPASFSSEHQVCCLGLFASWFWRVSATEAHLCWQVLVWDSMWVLLWRVCDSSVFWCVSVDSVCGIGILAAFCKMRNSGSTQKKLSYETMTKKKEGWLFAHVLFRLWRKLSKMKLSKLQNWFSLHMQLKKVRLIKCCFQNSDPERTETWLRESLKLTLIMSLRCKQPTLWRLQLWVNK